MKTLTLKKRRGRSRVGQVSLYAHHGAWWIYYREDGVVRRRRIGADYENARRVAAEINSQLTSARPTLFSFVPVSIEELVRRWLDHHEMGRNSSLATIRRYRAATQHLLNFAGIRGSTIGGHEIAPDAFVRYLRTIRVSSNGHSNTTKRPLRENGIRFILESCRSLYSFAASRSLLPPHFNNPFINLMRETSGPADGKPIKVLTPVQAARFLDTCDDWQFSVFFALATLGLRPGELTHLLAEDFDHAGGWIHIRNRSSLGWQVKTRRPRAVPVFDEQTAFFRRMLGSRQSGVMFLRRRFFREGKAPLAGLPAERLNAVLEEKIANHSRQIKRETTRWERQQIARMVWRDAGAIRDCRIRTEFMKVTRRIGMSDVTTPKSWRHSFATLLQDANVDLLIRQQVMGHAPMAGCATPGLGMTAVYTHTRPETYRREIRRALDLMPDVLRLSELRISKLATVEVEVR